MSKSKACCDCGQLNMESESAPVLELCCHCLDCQDALQEDYARIAFFKIKECAVTGDSDDKEYVAESGSKTLRQFCPQCNAPMFDRSEGFPHLLGVMVERLDAAFVSNPACHVFVRDKKSRVSIPEGMKQYDKGIE